MTSTWIIYDSEFGNTEKIARVIGESLNNENQVRVSRVDQVRFDQVKDVDLLIIGSPTQRFMPTKGITRFLNEIPSKGLWGIKVAAFDTRFTEYEINKIRVLSFFVRIFGYAAKPIANKLKSKGGQLVIPAEGFYVEGMEGPLLEGELDRAVTWTKKIQQLTS